MMNTQRSIKKLCRSWVRAGNQKATHVIMPHKQYFDFCLWVYKKNGSEHTPLQWDGMIVLSSFDITEIKVGALS